MCGLHNLNRRPNQQPTPICWILAPLRPRIEPARSSLKDPESAGAVDGRGHGDNPSSRGQLMKLKLVTFISVVAVSGLTLAIPAAETTKAVASEQGRAVQPERLGRVAKASEVLGMEVKNL